MIWSEKQQPIMYMTCYLKFYNVIFMKSQSKDLSKSQQICQSSKSQSENGGISVEHQKTPLHFHSILCIPDLLDNPANSEHCFMSYLFRNKQIKKVRRNQHFLSVDLTPKRDYKASDVMQNYAFKSEELQNQLKSVHSSLSEVFSKNQNINQIFKGLTKQDEFNSWLLSVKDKNMIVWFLQYSQKGPQLKSFSVSSGLLKLLDYKIDELALDIQHLGAQALDLVDGQAYKTSFLMLITSLRKFKQMELKGGITKEEILKQGQRTIINDMTGKSNRKITVETKIFMVSENIFCYEVLRILDKKQIRDNLRKLKRDNAIFNVQQLAFQSLSKIAKLPGIIDPSNSSKICRYVEIRQRPGNKAEKIETDDQKAIDKNSQ